MGYQPTEYIIEKRYPKRYYIKDNNYPCIFTGPFFSLRAARKGLKERIEREKNYPKILERYNSDMRRID